MIQWRLEESRGRKGRYIALSHRWSPDEEPLVTTKDNIECRLETCQHSPCTAREETPIARLFFEACVLCINLGIDKLWIDSVCIIQRDPEDWALEAVKMAEYYQFAWLTIATTHETFFGDPELPDLPRTARLPYRDQDGEQQGHFYLQAFTPSLVAQTYREKIEASSLFKRGWIFQERLLSRRILLITASSWGTFLECQNDCPMAMTGDFADPRRLRLHGIEMQANSVFQLEYLWKKAVVLYSELELGFIVKDRVVALAGIAAEFGEAFTRMLSKELSASTATTISFPQNCYAAGLWLSDKTCLCWEQSRVQSTTRISGIPTWSWASLMNKDGSSPCGISVEWPHIVERDYAFTMYRIEEAEMIRVDTTTWEPSYTQVSRCSPDTHSYGNDCRFAALKLHGCMVPISIGTRFTSEEAVIAARVSNHRPDFGRLNWRRVAADSESRVVAGWASVEHPDFQNDASCRSASFVAFVLMIAASGQGSLGMGSLWRSRRGYIVLYLREITGLRSNYTPCYERVGVGRLFEPELGKSIVPGAEKSIWLL